MRRTHSLLLAPNRVHDVSLTSAERLSTGRAVGILIRLSVLVSLANGMTFCASRDAVGQQEEPAADATSSESAAEATPRRGKSLINDAYEKTKSAKTVDQFTEVLDLCKTALLDDLSQAHVDYAKKLMAWAHNKRGEKHADQAVESSKTNDTEAALEFDALALKDFETSLILDSKRWKAYHNRGVSYALLGRFEPAQGDFDKAIKLHGKYANTWFNRGEIHYQDENYDQAIKDYTEAIRIHPQDAGFYSARGNARFQTRRFRSSLSDFDRAVQLDTSNEIMYTDRADALSSLGEWGRAASDYRQAMDLSNDFGRAYQGAAWLMATCPIARYRDASRALQAAQRAVELDGENDYRYIDTLAAAQAANGDYSTALSLIARAIEVAPEEETQILERRKSLYERNQPFRQATRSRRATRR